MEGVGGVGPAVLSSSTCVSAWFNGYEVITSHDIITRCPDEADTVAVSGLDRYLS